MEFILHSELHSDLFFHNICVAQKHEEIYIYMCKIIPNKITMSLILVMVGLVILGYFLAKFNGKYSSIKGKYS